MFIKPPTKQEDIHNENIHTIDLQREKHDGSSGYCDWLGNDVAYSWGSGTLQLSRVYSAESRQATAPTILAISSF